MPHSWTSQDLHTSFDPRNPESSAVAHASELRARSCDQEGMTTERIFIRTRRMRRAEGDSTNPSPGQVRGPVRTLASVTRSPVCLMLRIAPLQRGYRSERAWPVDGACAVSDGTDIDLSFLTPRTIEHRGFMLDFEEPRTAECKASVAHGGWPRVHPTVKEIWKPGQDSIVTTGRYAKNTSGGGRTCQP